MINYILILLCDVFISNRNKIIGDDEEYTICIKGENVGTITGSWTVVTDNGYYTNDGIVNIPNICSI